MLTQRQSMLARRQTLLMKWRRSAGAAANIADEVAKQVLRGGQAALTG
jgi:hypothetical protein